MDNGIDKVAQKAVAEAKKAMATKQSEVKEVATPTNKDKKTKVEES
jgi:hypothetical protein